MKQQFDTTFLFALSVYMSERLGQMMVDAGLPPTGTRASQNLSQTFFNWIREFEAHQVEVYGADHRFIKPENDNGEPTVPL